MPSLMTMLWCVQLYPEGKMSQCLDRLSVGDALQFKGPRGRFNYQPNMKRALGEGHPPSSASSTFEVVFLRGLLVQVQCPCG